MALTVLVKSRFKKKNFNKRTVGFEVLKCIFTHPTKPLQTVVGLYVMHRIRVAVHHIKRNFYWDDH